MAHEKCSCCKTTEHKSGYSEVIRSFEQKPENLIPTLHALQDNLGHLPDEAMHEVAAWLDIPVSNVYGTATFYTMFATEPKGRYVVRLCDSPPCHLEGSTTIKKTIIEELGIKPGETTEDGNFTFEIVSCFGLCGVAPAIMVNEDVYGNLTTKSVRDILCKYRTKES